jgi:hypothetical protein
VLHFAHCAPKDGILNPLRRIRAARTFHRWTASLSATVVLLRDLGHWHSVVSGKSIDRDGQPLPWYTYPAIEFLNQLDFSTTSVFEYGSGMSTLFWAARARRVVSVEDDEHWFRTVAARAPSNVQLLLETDLSRFPQVILQTDEHFDIIIVDGPARGRTRLKCCHAALQALKPGGLIVLDNSDWLPESSRALRRGGLLEVDMTGFVPICGHVQTTSFYFDRTFNVPPLAERQPVPGCGAKRMNWEPPFTPVPGDVIECDGERYGGVTIRHTMQFDSPRGLRSFEGFTYLGVDDTRKIGIIDLDRRRVVVTRHQARGDNDPPAVNQEFERLERLSWTDFCSFVDGHSYRRYRLSEPLGGG